MSSDPFGAPRAKNGRAPDVFRKGAWVPMREYRMSESVDFVIVGTGAGGGTLAASLAEQGFSVVAFDAGAYFRPLEDFASDETEQNKLYWTDKRVVDGSNPIQMGGKNSVLLNSASDRHPDGLANSSGLVGKNLMTQSNQAVWGRMDEEVRWYKGPPSLAITEHWNYDDRKDFFGGYCWMGQGPLPIEWSSIQTGSRALWGQGLRDAMLDYNHMIGVEMVGEMLPDEANRVTLAGDVDQYGLRVARITYRWSDNDHALIEHALEQMGRSIEAIGATDMFRQENDTNHPGGTARMGDDPARSVVDADCRSWDIRNLWMCDGSVFPTVGGVNPALTIQTIALRTGTRIGELAARGEL